jgi:hypothetical protein
LFPGNPECLVRRLSGGNGGQHLLWVDPARELVLTSHSTEDALTLICDVSSVGGVSNAQKRYSHVEFCLSVAVFTRRLRRPVNAMLRDRSTINAVHAPFRSVGAAGLEPATSAV